MHQIITYLTFNGNCREAMEFYQCCLGGELILQTISETPEGGKFPDTFKDLILNACLKNENMLLMGTDLNDNNLIKGNAVSILIDSNNEEQIMKYYQKLGEGGTVIQPLGKTYWGNLFGGLTDRYGHHWLFQCRKGGTQRKNSI